MSSDLRPALAKEAARLEEDVLFAEKQHFSMATIWRRVHLALGIPASVFAALAGLSAVQSRPILAASLAICSAILSALLTFLNPAEAGSAHHHAGIKYGTVRGKLRRLRELDLIGEVSLELRRDVENLAAEKAEIMEASPHIGGLAYRLGKASILREEHKHAVDN